MFGWTHPMGPDWQKLTSYLKKCKDRIKRLDIPERVLNHCRLESVNACGNVFESI